jgi:putative FmdB family regulatory protein
MPIYEYKCDECGREFEVFQRITDPEVKTCKFCHSHAKKLVSLSSFHLKGTGWYVTDYGGRKVPSGEGSKNDKKTSSESGEAKKTEATPKTDNET